MTEPSFLYIQTSSMYSIGFNPNFFIAAFSLLSSSTFYTLPLLLEGKFLTRALPLRFFALPNFWNLDCLTDSSMTKSSPPRRELMLKKIVILTNIRIFFNNF